MIGVHSSSLQLLLPKTVSHKDGGKARLKKGRQARYKDVRQALSRNG